MAKDAPYRHSEDHIAVVSHATRRPILISGETLADCLHVATSTRRRLILLGTAAPGLTALLAACGSPLSSSEPVRPAQKELVEWWAPATGTLKPPIEDLVARANASNRQIDVTVTPQSIGITEESRAKFTAAVAAGTPPDLIYVDRYLVRSFGALQLIGSLDSNFKSSKTVKADEFWPHLIKDVTWRGSIWGTPFTTDVRVLYWHKALFADSGLDPDKPPTTWDGVESMADRLVKRNIDGTLERVGFVPHWGNPPSFYSYFLYLWQAGGEFLSPDESKPAFNSPEGLRALEWMVRQVQKVGGTKALMPLTTGFDSGPGRDVFSVGRLGIQYHTNNTRQVYRQALPDLKFGVGALPLPSGGRPVNYSGGFALGIPKAARHPAGAWRLSEFLASREAQIPFARAVDTIPVLKPVATSVDYQQNDQDRKLFVEELQRGAKWVPTIVGTVDVLNAFGKEFNAAIDGQKPPRDALNDAAAQVQMVLNQYAQYL